MACAALPEVESAGAEPAAAENSSTLQVAQLADPPDEDSDGAALQALPPVDVMDQEFSTQPYNMPTPLEPQIANILGRLEALEKGDGGGKGEKKPDVNAKLKEEFDVNDGVGDWRDLSGDKWAKCELRWIERRICVQDRVDVLIGKRKRKNWRIG